MCLFSFIFFTFPLFAFFSSFSFISPRLSDCGSVPPAPLANVALATAMGVRVTYWCRKNGAEKMVGIVWLVRVNPFVIGLEVYSSFMNA